jgi:hypothetical protein
LKIERRDIPTHATYSHPQSERSNKSEALVHQSTHRANYVIETGTRSSRAATGGARPRRSSPRHFNARAKTMHPFKIQINAHSNINGAPLSGGSPAQGAVGGAYEVLASRSRAGRWRYQARDEHALPVTSVTPVATSSRSPVLSALSFSHPKIKSVRTCIHQFASHEGDFQWISRPREIREEMHTDWKCVRISNGFPLDFQSTGNATEMHAHFQCWKCTCISTSISRSEEICRKS